jgi:hypothetical protein
MLRTSLGVVIVAIALAGCSSLAPTQRSVTPDSSKPQVFVIDDTHLIVNAEPLLFRRKQGEVRIVWQLPQDGGYRFDEREGVKIEGRVTKVPVGTTLRPEATAAQQARPDAPREVFNTIERRQDEIVDCRVERGGLAFSCLNRNRAPGIFAYTLTVRTPSGKAIILDPNIMNDK